LGRNLRGQRGRNRLIAEVEAIGTLALVTTFPIVLVLLYSSCITNATIAAQDVADAYQNLATTITYQGRYDESIPLHRKAYEVYKAELDGHYIVAFPLLSIASIEVDRGNADVAQGSAMVEASHPLILKHEVPVPRYVELCRVQVAD
jgi:hypothetical protein